MSAVNRSINTFNAEFAQLPETLCPQLFSKYFLAHHALQRVVCQKVFGEKLTTRPPLQLAFKLF